MIMRTMSIGLRQMNNLKHTDGIPLLLSTIKQVIDEHSTESERSKLRMWTISK